MGMVYVGTLLFSSLKRKETSAVIDLDVLLWFGKRTELFYRGMSETILWVCGTAFASVHSVDVLCF